MLSGTVCEYVHVRECIYVNGFSEARFETMMSVRMLT